MPLFPTPKDTSPFLSNDPEIRRAERVYEAPGWLTGKRTFIGLGLMIAGMIGKMFKVEVPTDQINSALDVVEQNWQSVAEIIGAAVALYGAVSKSLRHKEAVAVVAVVTEKLVEAKVEVAETKTELAETKIDLHVKTVELAEVAKSIPTPKK